MFDPFYTISRHKSHCACMNNNIKKNLYRNRCWRWRFQATRFRLPLDVTRCRIRTDKLFFCCPEDDRWRRYSSEYKRRRLAHSWIQSNMPVALFAPAVDIVAAVARFQALASSMELLLSVQTKLWRQPFADTKNSIEMMTYYVARPLIDSMIAQCFSCPIHNFRMSATPTKQY